MRALFYAVALVAGPILGVLAGLAAGGQLSDAVAWTLLLGLPAVVTIVLGWALRRSAAETVVLALVSSALAFGGLLLFVWYLLSVNEFS
jgi:hypothetical protein